MDCITALLLSEVIHVKCITLGLQCPMLHCISQFMNKQNTLHWDCISPRYIEIVLVSLWTNHWDCIALCYIGIVLWTNKTYYTGTSWPYITLGLYWYLYFETKHYIGIVLVSEATNHTTLGLHYPMLHWDYINLFMTIQNIILGLSLWGNKSHYINFFKQMQNTAVLLYSPYILTC